MRNWISFKDLRAHLDFDQVLTHYGVKLTAKGDQRNGFCPLPTHEGERKSPSFSANVARGIWQCFGCRAKGNVLDFAVRMEGLDPTKGEDVRKVALKLVEEFNISAAVTGEEQREQKKDEQARTPAAPQKEKSQPAVAEKKVLVNAPLDFELKGLDQAHPYLAARGLQTDTVAYFGLGYASRGLMQGRVAIPLHDSGGQLVGYVGRLVDDAAVSAEHPKYKFPSGREHAGVVHEFRKSLLVYHEHSITEQVQNLIVVEGFPSVWWLWQAGWPRAVALMGASASETQIELIVEAVAPEGHVWLMPDGDEAGAHCAQDLLAKIAPQRFIRWVKLGSGKQPTDYSAEALAGILPAK